MSEPLPRTAGRWVEAVLGLRIADAVALAGATSSSVYRLRFEGNAPNAVLRLHTNASWLASEPDLAVHEHAALAHAVRYGLPAPEPLAADENGGVAGAPALLMSALPGTVTLRPPAMATWLDALAAALAAVHAVPAESFGWRYRSWLHFADLAVPPWSSEPSAWARCIAVARGAPPAEPDVFLHRDYHPANVLWQEGRISAVVDWVNACAGPRGADIAHCRGNLVQMYGIDAADQFLAGYCERVPAYAHHPYWDLQCAADHLPDPTGYGPWEAFGLPVPSRPLLRGRIESLLTQALSRLSRGGRSR